MEKIDIELNKDDLAVLSAAAHESGETLNGFMVRGVMEKLHRLQIEELEDEIGSLRKALAETYDLNQELQKELEELKLGIAEFKHAENTVGDRNLQVGDEVKIRDGVRPYAKKTGVISEISLDKDDYPYTVTVDVRYKPDMNYHSEELLLLRPVEKQ